MLDYNIVNSFLNCSSALLHFLKDVVTITKLISRDRSHTSPNNFKHAENYMYKTTTVLHARTFPYDSFTGTCYIVNLVKNRCRPIDKIKFLT